MIAGLPKVKVRVNPSPWDLKPELFYFSTSTPGEPALGTPAQGQSSRAPSLEISLFCNMEGQANLAPKTTLGGTSLVAQW